METPPLLCKHGWGKDDKVITNLSTTFPFLVFLPGVTMVWAIT